MRSHALLGPWIGAMVALCGNQYHFAWGKGIVLSVGRDLQLLPFSCFRRYMYEEYYSIF